MQEENNTPQQDEQEIDLLELAGKLWKERKLLLKLAGIGAIVGLVIAFSIPKEYTTTIKLVPEIQDGKSGSAGLGALASMAGINLSSGSGGDAVNPQLYPDVVSSVPFNMALFNVEVPLSDKNGEVQETTVRNYIEEDLSSPWWSVIISAPFKLIGLVKNLFTSDEDNTEHIPNSFQITTEEDNVIKALNNRVSVNVDTKTAVITLGVTMQDPLVSATLADTIAENLKAYITDYRTNKARTDLNYAQKINNEAKDEYYNAQQRYAEYVDKNHGITLNSRRTEEERLRNEAQLAYNLYNTTAQQLQMAKAKVQENTPVYTVLQPATVPLKASKPSKVMILVGFVFLAVVGGAVWILFGRDFKDKFKEAAAEN